MRRAAAMGALALALAAGPALAGKPVPPPERASGPLSRHLEPGVSGGGPLCRLGVTDTSLNIVNYLTPPRDRYFTHLPAGSCPGCAAPDSAVIKFAHVVLDFSIQCVVSVQVGVVGAVNQGGCLVPDTTVVLCPPRSVDLEPPASGMFDLAAAMASDCRVAGEAFLLVEFDGFGAECAAFNDRPRLVVSSSCENCDSYNHFPSGGDWGGVDLCRIGLSSPTMYVDVEACATPAARRSWGSLKILYR